MGPVELHEAMWLLIEREDGSPRGVALVAKPESLAEVGSEVRYSFGVFTLVGLEDESFNGISMLEQSELGAGHGCLRVRQIDEGPELWDITSAPEFMGRIDMRAA